MAEVWKWLCKTTKHKPAREWDRVKKRRQQWNFSHEIKVSEEEGEEGEKKKAEKTKKSWHMLGREWKKLHYIFQSNHYKQKSAEGRKLQQQQREAKKTHSKSFVLTLDSSLLHCWQWNEIFAAQSRREDSRRLWVLVVVVFVDSVKNVFLIGEINFEKIFNTFENDTHSRERWGEVGLGLTMMMMMMPVCARRERRRSERRDEIQNVVAMRRFFAGSTSSMMVIKSENRQRTAVWVVENCSVSHSLSSCMLESDVFWVVVADFISHSEVRASFDDGVFWTFFSNVLWLWNLILFLATLENHFELAISFWHHLFSSFFVRF